MKAAVVNDFSLPPRYQDFPDPVARGEGEVVVEVLAAGLHPRVRSQAGGFHYTSTDELPLIPGIDAVIRDPPEPSATPSSTTRPSGRWPSGP